MLHHHIDHSKCVVDIEESLLSPRPIHQRTLGRLLQSRTSHVSVWHTLHSEYVYPYHISLYKDMKILMLHVCICVVSAHSFSLP
jgi:hypothetical protein